MIPINKKSRIRKQVNMTKITLTAKSEVRENSISGFPNSQNFKRKVHAEANSHNGFPIAWSMTAEIPVFLFVYSNQKNEKEIGIERRNPDGTSGKLIY